MHDACGRLPRWQSTREPKPYVMYSLRHGVNLSRRACRIAILLLAVLLLAAGATTASPLLNNNRPQPDPLPIPDDYSYNKPYDGVDFGPMGPRRLLESGGQTSANTVTPPCGSSSSTSSPNAGDPEITKPQRYQVASVSFQRVKTPFIIGLWIFCASLAKIGKWSWEIL